MLAIFLSAISATGAAGADEPAGPARILDGDTVEVSGARIRLEGIDTPETDQICLDSKGKNWACGVAARDRLDERMAGRSLTCRWTEHDRYHRALGTCVVAGENINRWMVREGWALAFVRYSRRYESEESAARKAHRGLWSGAFIAPWDWRSRNTKSVVLGAVSVPIHAQRVLLSPASAAGAPSRDCTIKANLRSKRGCIYHQPGTRHYRVLRMDRSGRRWFCSPSEAEAAGCRPARR